MSTKKGHMLGHPNYLLKHTDATKKKISENSAKYWLGKKRPPLSPEHNAKLHAKSKGNQYAKGMKFPNRKKAPPKSEATREKHSLYRGEKAGHWKGGITKANHIGRTGIKYTKWRNEVLDRDVHKCRIADENCSKRVIAHHILGFKSFPELRYAVNNGIALCDFHHPATRKDEERLSPYFKELVAQIP